MQQRLENALGLSRKPLHLVEDILFQQSWKHQTGWVYLAFSAWALIVNTGQSLFRQRSISRASMDAIWLAVQPMLSATIPFSRSIDKIDLLRCSASGHCQQALPTNATACWRIFFSILVAFESFKITLMRAWRASAAIKARWSFLSSIPSFWKEPFKESLSLQDVRHAIIRKLSNGVLVFCTSDVWFPFSQSPLITLAQPGVVLLLADLFIGRAIVNLGTTKKGRLGIEPFQIRERYGLFTCLELSWRIHR